AATTDEGALPEPLRARFPLREVLVRLNDAEVAEALRRAGSRIGVALGDGAAELLASVSNGTPRQALALLGRARDEMASRGGTEADVECARAALARAGIDERGLGPVEREIVTLLADGRARALAQIAAAVGAPAGAGARVHG